ncbi:MAG: 50S ribosomal protein L9 [Chloroflexi bacterium]|nr:50S ribosomal protein L9 [Chloroflexota bacterium]MCI0833845.1 50S ribosomal protein L9 [Chloroflexota bacterium]MCI0835569.1 50S ribosomal protein L9 [Chloroflexota bacterium]MCI0851169.1 50S ribosomal protein L9 [Chloroflexota bacterium]
MKVLFLQDVRPRARAGDVKEVKNGFARNYLIPQGFAVQATEHELRRAAGLRQQADDRRLQEAREWQDVADALQDEKVRIEVRTGPTGRLYGSVTNTMIAAELARMTGREIDRKGIQIPAPIRAVGDYKIPARLVEGVSATLVVEVVADDASVELNKQLEEVSDLIVEEDKNILDPSFEDVLAAAEARIDAEASGESEESEESDDESESESESGEAADESESDETADESDSRSESEDAKESEEASEEKSE